MSEPVWVRRDVLELLHSESIAEHGGSDGLRDANLLESALARPRNLAAYDKVDDPCRLAASYAFGLVKNHAFVDGNKRIAFIAAALFLRLNGLRLAADQVDATLAVLALASGEIREAEYADWLRRNTRTA